MSASSAAFWRSSVAVVSTARPMPVFSLSSVTCMPTTPSSAAPSSQIHRRPRSARSSQRLSGSARTRANPVWRPTVAAPPGTATGRRVTGPETRRVERGAIVLSTVRRWAGRAERAVALMRAPPRR